jgi:hypothetical protein
VILTSEKVSSMTSAFGFAHSSGTKKVSHVQVFAALRKCARSLYVFAELIKNAPKKPGVLNCIPVY